MSITVITTGLNISNIIRQALDAWEMSVEELAGKIDRHTLTINSWLNGYYLPALTARKRLCEVLQIDPNVFSKAYNDDKVVQRKQKNGNGGTKFINTISRMRDEVVSHTSLEDALMDVLDTATTMTSLNKHQLATARSIISSLDALNETQCNTLQVMVAALASHGSVGGAA